MGDLGGQEARNAPFIRPDTNRKRKTMQNNCKVINMDQANYPPQNMSRDRPRKAVRQQQQMTAGGDSLVISIGCREFDRCGVSLEC